MWPLIIVNDNHTNNSSMNYTLGYIWHKLFLYNLCQIYYFETTKIIGISVTFFLLTRI